MFANYLTLAFRNFFKHKSFTLISLFGLVVGISSALVLVLYAHQELTFDGSHSNRSKIYHVYKERQTPAGPVLTYDTWVPLLPALKDKFPSVEDGARVLNYPGIISVNEKAFNEKVTFADPSLFRLFNLTVRNGDGYSILSRKSDIIISRPAATRLFGSADPIGESIHARVGGVDYDLVVGGVFEDIPVNSTVRPDILIAFENAMNIEDVKNGEWDSAFLTTYIMISSKDQALQLESQFPILVREVLEADMTQRMKFLLVSMDEYHEQVAGSNRAAYIMICIAVIILVIAVVNYINLATVRSVERAKEIGLRKVLGATRLSLIRQFLGESTITTAIALIGALVILQAAMPTINSLLNISLSLRLLRDPLLLVALLLVFILISILSGSFPAFFISAGSVVQSIRGKMKTSPGSMILKRVLIVIQFSLSVMLLFSTLVIYQQINYLREHDLGFDKENILVIPTDSDNMPDPVAARAKIASLKKELLAQSQIVAVSSSDIVPSDLSFASFTTTRPDGWADENPFRIMRVMVDESYFELYNVEFVEGGNFHDHLAPLDTAVRNFAIINEAAMKAFGWGTAENKKAGRRTQVVGVVRDHHYTHLGSKVEPTLFVFRPTENQANAFISVRLRGNPHDMISYLAEKWKELDTVRPFAWFFVDSNFDRLYRREDRDIRIVTWFSACAVIIACVGLLGLIGFLVNQKQKEIGIRKVLGASDAKIVFMFNREFALLIFIAMVIALPVAHYAMQQWLSGFALQTSVHWSVYPAVILVTSFLALSTTSIRILKATSRNPVESLRTE
ncbi:MAG TPA: FtsX-like permease family protein [Chryseolinea sp.]|nr:FtsX-like permease family protein [Chryseolinea sp.]